MKITKKWLKTKGWDIRESDAFPFEEGLFYFATKMFGKDKVLWNDEHQLTILRDYSEGNNTYADVLIDNIDTVEKLMEALTLCEVGNFEEYDWLYETWLDKACRWLVEHSHNSDMQDEITCTPVMTEGTLIEDFRKAMTKKTNPIFERCLAKVNPDIRAEVHKNMDTALAWHKVSEELPMYDIAVIVAYSKYDWDMCFNHRSNNPEVKTTKNGWCDVGFDGEPMYWMPIPEIKED